LYRYQLWQCVAIHCLPLPVWYAKRC
jgi:hypothetical protein